MSKREEAGQVYARLCKRIPRQENAALDTLQPFREVLITCVCGAQYRTDANVEPERVLPTGDYLKALDLACGNCGTPAGDFALLSGSSGGVFNCSVSQQWAGRLTSFSETGEMYNCREDA